MADITEFIQQDYSNEKLDTKGFEDPSREWPRQSYLNTASTNQAARGIKTNKVYTGGGYKNVSLDLKPVQPSSYPNNQVRETVSGHITEIDDTPGAERMLFRHRTGSGVEMRADGTVIISSTNNTVRVTCCDEKVIVDGDAEMIYNGNLSLQVAGDFDLVVGGNFNITTGGNKNEEIRGSHKQQVRKTQKTIVTEHQSNFVGGVQTETVLGNSNKIVKGIDKSIVEGGVEVFSGNDILMTAEDTVVISADNANVMADNLTVIGATGTFGGAGITHYGNTFHGSLNGVSTGALVAGGIGPPGTQTISSTVQPTSGILNDILHNNSFGVREVSVDPGNVLKSSFDKTENYGGIASRELTVEEVRSKLRDANALNNRKFIGAMISEGKLNPKYAQQSPSKIGRTASLKSNPGRGVRPIGNNADLTKRFTT